MTRTAAFAAFALAAGLSVPAGAASLPMDGPVTLDSGITAVCTGIGDAKDDPRWKAYPVRVEFANETMHYLAGAHVTLKNSDGMQLADFDCSGAWVLLQLPAGNYTVTATLSHRREMLPEVSARFSPPKTGQKRVVLVYKGANPAE